MSHQATSASDPTVPADQVLREVDRILQSSIFRGSEPLRKLLSYLADRYLSEGCVPVKENELALAVFGRQHDFDSRLDSIVRVHAGRLRAKLAEYYMGEGRQDLLVLEIPKGFYQLAARHRAPSMVAEELDHSNSNRRIWQFAGAVLLLIAIAGLASGVRKDDSAAVRRFWRSMTVSGAEPILVFTNPAFTGSSTTGLYLYQPGIEGASALNDTYTGTGEVIAVHELTKLFAGIHGSFRVKRAGLLTWDEASGHDLIFLGAPIQNAPAGEVKLREFRFEQREGSTVIVNVHQRPGEQAFYAAPKERPIQSDYAVIASVRSPTAARRAVVLAGTTTYGTQAAAQFACREDAVAGMLSKLGPARNGVLPDFEALIDVRVVGGVALQWNMLAVHREAGQ